VIFNTYIRPLPIKVTPLNRPGFKFTEIVKYYQIGPLKTGNPFFSGHVSDAKRK
jgi:hypothetical protein